MTGRVGLTGLQLQLNNHQLLAAHNLSCAINQSGRHLELHVDRISSSTAVQDLWRRLHTLAADSENSVKGYSSSAGFQKLLQHVLHTKLQDLRLTLSSIQLSTGAHSELYRYITTDTIYLVCQIRYLPYEQYRMYNIYLIYVLHPTIHS